MNIFGESIILIIELIDKKIKTKHYFAKLIIKSNHKKNLLFDLKIKL